LETATPCFQVHIKQLNKIQEEDHQRSNRQVTLERPFLSK